MDINNVSTFITLDPSKLFNAEGLYQRAMVMYEGDEDLIESFLKEHLASDSLAYAMHLLEETSSTSYMGVKIHYNGTSFSAPTAGVYGVKSRPEIKARIKAKVLKRNENQNKAAALKKEDVEVVEGYKGTADLSKSHPEAVKKVEKNIEKGLGEKVPGGKMGVKKEEINPFVQSSLEALGSVVKKNFLSGVTNAFIYFLLSMKNFKLSFSNSVSCTRILLISLSRFSTSASLIMLIWSA